MGVANTVQYQTRIPVSTAVAVVPPYAVVRLVSSATDEAAGQTVWTVAAPDANSDPHVYVLGNKTLTNDPGDRGDAMFLPLGRVAYDPADGTPAMDEEWGPKAGEFLLRKGQLGFRCAGEADGNTAVFARTGGGSESGIVDVKITGALASNYYPAVLTNWDVATAAYIDESVSVRVRPLDGGSLESGRRYRGKSIGTVTISSTDYPAYEVIGDADWKTRSGSEETAWAGGLVSTASQSIKGAKKFRDTLVVERPENVTSSSFPSIFGGTEVLSQGRVTLQTIGSDDLNTNGAKVSLITQSPSTVGAANYAGLRVDAFTEYAQLYLNTAFLTSQRGASGIICDAAAGFMLNGSTYTAYGCRGLGGATEEVTVDGVTLKFVGGIYVGRVSTDPPPPPPPPPSGQGQLRVLVFADTDEDGSRGAGEPGIANRLVTISGSAASGGITDANGYYTFDNLAPGKYAVTATLQPGETCATNGNQETVVADTLVDVARPIVLSPPPPATGAIAIVVVKDGTDYLNRTVSVSGPTPMSGTSAAYLYPLFAGDYTATVTPSGDTGTWAWSIAGGASGSGTTTGTIVCDGLTQKNVTFSLTSPPPTYSISGNVTKDGSPYAGREILLDPLPGTSVFTDASGNYEFTGVTAGSHTWEPAVIGGESSTPASYTETISASVTGKDFAITTGGGGPP